MGSTGFLPLRFFIKPVGFMPICSMKMILKPRVLMAATKLRFTVVHMGNKTTINK